jgi:hypothetical protein
MKIHSNEINETNYNNYNNKNDDCTPLDLKEQ